MSCRLNLDARRRLKEALTVLIVTHVARCRKGRKKFLTFLSWGNPSCAHVERVERSLNSFTFITFSLTRLNGCFNPQKVLDKLRTETFPTIPPQCYVCRSMSKGSKVKITFDPFDIGIALGWVMVGKVRGVPAFQNFLRIENPFNIKDSYEQNC